jgi:hypothetical protein
VHRPRKKSALGKIDLFDNRRAPLKFVSGIMRGEYAGAVEAELMKLIRRSVRLFRGMNDNILRMFQCREMYCRFILNAHYRQRPAKRHDAHFWAGGSVRSDATSGMLRHNG